MTREVVMHARWVKLKMKIPVIRKPMKLGTPRLVPRMTPKIR